MSLQSHSSPQLCCSPLHCRHHSLQSCRSRAWVHTHQDPQDKAQAGHDEALEEDDEVVEQDEVWDVEVMEQDDELEEEVGHEEVVLVHGAVVQHV